VVVEVAALVVVVPARAVVVVVGTVVVVAGWVVVVGLEVVVLDGVTPEVVAVVFGLEIVVVVVVLLVGTVLVGGAPAVVVVVGSARGTGGPIPLVRDGGFVVVVVGAAVGTGTVGLGGAVVVGEGLSDVVGGAYRGAVVVGADVGGADVAGGVVVGGVVVCAVVVGAVVVCAVVVGAVVVCAVVVGTVVVGGVDVRPAVVGAVMAVSGGVVVELVEAVAGPGTSACAVRLSEPKAWLSLAFSASSLVSRSIWTARSFFSAATAAASLAVDACAGRDAGAFPRMAFEARSMYCLAFAGSCLAK
jgi:hypothetical protein